MIQIPMKTTAKRYRFIAFLSFVVLLFMLLQFLIGVWLNTKLSEWGETLNQQPGVEAHWQQSSSGLHTRNGILTVSFIDYLGISRQMQADIQYQWRLFNGEMKASVMLEHQPFGDLSATVHGFSKSLTLQMNVHAWQDAQSALLIKPAQLHFTGEMSKWMNIQIDGAGFQIPQPDMPNQLIKSAAYQVQGRGSLDINVQTPLQFALKSEQLTFDTETNPLQLAQPALQFKLEQVLSSEHEVLLIQPELSMTSLTWIDAENRHMEVRNGQASFVFGAIHPQRLSALFDELSEPESSTTALISAIDDITTSPLSIDTIHVQGRFNQMPVDLTGVIHIQPFSFRQFVFLMYQQKAGSLFTVRGDASIQSFDKQQLPSAWLSWYEYGKQFGWFADKNQRLTSTIDCQLGVCSMNGVKVQ